MNPVVTLLLLGCVALAHARMMAPGKYECRRSAECGNTQGRSLCVNGECIRDIPCNKQSDCLTWVYGEASCYRFKLINRGPGYGTCLEKTHGDGRYPLLKGY